MTTAQARKRAPRAACPLAAAAGFDELCDPSCPFWEQGGAALPGGCIVSRAGVDLRRKDRVDRLIELRSRLAGSSDLAQSALAGEALRELGLTPGD